MLLGTKAATRTIERAQFNQTTKPQSKGFKEFLFCDGTTKIGSKRNPTTKNGARKVGAKVRVQAVSRGAEPVDLAS